MVNTGGRVTFSPQSEVRILRVDGKISPEVYIVDAEKSDRKGHITLKERGATKSVKVHFRRVLPVSVEGQAAVIESGGKCRAICPNCNYIETVTAVSECLTCPSHGQFQLYWLGAKPMTETVEKKTGKNREKSVAGPKPERAPKVVRQPIVVDLDAIASNADCELWTKGDVAFDHERINVQSHTIIFTGTNPRKFCFNTYNGTLGKDADQLPIEEFLADKEVAGAKKSKPWFAVADLEKARTKLQKSGYEQRK